MHEVLERDDLCKPSCLNFNQMHDTTSPAVPKSPQSRAYGGSYVSCDI